MFIPVLFILFAASFSLVQISYADNTWQEINVDSPLDNKTKYIFYYDSKGIELTDILYFDRTQPTLFFSTTKVADKQIQIMVPKNYPIESPLSWLMLSDGVERVFEYEESDCFYDYTIPVYNSTKFEFIATAHYHYYLDNDEPFTSDDYCLPHTIANYPHSIKTYENIRGEQVNVYLSSVLKLLERNYLVEAID